MTYKEAIDITVEALEKIEELETGVTDIEDTLNDVYTLHELYLNKLIHGEPMSEYECIVESFSLKVMQNLEWILGVIKRSEKE